MNSENRYVTYVNKKGERSTMPLNQALDSNNAEMTKRLKYTKYILTHMLNNNQQPNPVSRGPEGMIPAGTAPLTSNSSRRAGGAANMMQGLPIGGTPMSVQTPVSNGGMNSKRKISIGSRGAL